MADAVINGKVAAGLAHNGTIIWENNGGNTGSFMLYQQLKTPEDKNGIWIETDSKDKYDLYFTTDYDPTNSSIISSINTTINFNNDYASLWTRSENDPNILFVIRIIQNTAYRDYDIYFYNYNISTNTYTQINKINISESQYEYGDHGFGTFTGVSATIDNIFYNFYGWAKNRYILTYDINKKVINIESSAFSNEDPGFSESFYAIINKKFYFFGGCVNYHDPNKRAEFYDINTKSFTKLKELPFYDYYGDGVAFVNDNNINIITGQSVYQYNITSNTYTKIATSIGIDYDDHRIPLGIKKDTFYSCDRNEGIQEYNILTKKAIQRERKSFPGNPEDSNTIYDEKTNSIYIFEDNLRYNYKIDPVNRKVIAQVLNLYLYNEYEAKISNSDIKRYIGNGTNWIEK